jgi:CubicO group peptidase (beta-lactamase class C family)
MSSRLRIPAVLLSSGLFLLSLISSHSAHPNSRSYEDFTQEQRLERLVDILEQKRREFHVPGMALAVVKDDRIILARGFGLADMEAQRSVTPETVFAIGSSSKAFGTSLIGMLVDEGKMKWDDPIVRHLPYFKLKINGPKEGAQVTLRDLLCHRTGLMRMNLLLLHAGASREEALRLATQAEPMVGFRKSFHYTNVMHTAAGEAAARAEGKDWDSLIRERIFDPLDMAHTTTSVQTASKGPHIATGYIWEEYVQRSKPLALRPLDIMGPAGAIHSCASDMANWVRFQLKQGEFEGKRLLSESSHQETWTPQFLFSENNAYALGWFVQDWNGQLLVQHGGGVDGFSTQVALLPESQLGYVLLCNNQSSPLTRASMNIVWETLLGEKPELPTVEEILRLRRSDAARQTVRDWGGFRLTGTVARPQSGVNGSISWAAAGHDRFIQEQDFDRLGHVTLALNPEKAAVSDTVFLYQELRGRFYTQARLQHPAAVFGDWREFFETMEVTGKKEQKGRAVYTLKLTAKDVPPYTVTVDAETGDLLSANTQWMRPGSTAQMVEISIFEEYREVQGLRIPYKITTMNPYHGRIIMQFEDLETQIMLRDDLFTLPSPDKKNSRQ